MPRSWFVAAVNGTEQIPSLNAGTDIATNGGSLAVRDEVAPAEVRTQPDADVIVDAVSGLTEGNSADANDAAAGSNDDSRTAGTNGAVATEAPPRSVRPDPG